MESVVNVSVNLRISHTGFTLSHVRFCFTFSL